MKKIAVLLVILLVFIVVGSAAAQPPPESGFKAVGVDVQLKISGNWVPVKPGDPVPIYPPPCPEPLPIEGPVLEMHCLD